LSPIYQKGEILGVGPFATVYSGWDQLLDREVAIKELRQPFAADEGFVRAFLGRSLEMLDVADDHLLATYAADGSQHPPVVVRELADETLEAVAIASPLSPEEVEEVLCQALAGLGALHRRGKTHGAIKPQNLFRCAERYKVGDVGAPALPDGAALPARECRYTAPEVLRREGAGGPAGDLYSLGLVAYELLLGQIGFERLGEELVREADLATARDLPASGDEIWALLNASTVEIPPPHERIGGVPMALSLVLHQMTRKVPAERSTSVETVLASLGAGSPTEVPDPPPPAERGSRRTAVSSVGGKVRIDFIAHADPRLASATRHARAGGPAGPAPPPQTGMPARSASATRTTSGTRAALASRSSAPADSEDEPTTIVRRAPPGTVRRSGESARQPARRSPLGMAGALAAAALAAVALAGLGWLLASRSSSSARPRTVAATLPCPPSSFASSSDAATLVEGLRAIVSGGPGLAIELDLPGGGSPERLGLGTPLGFRLTSDRPGHFALFVISSDGGIIRFYPNSWQTDLAISSPQGGSLELPSEAERRAGFKLRADRPLGRDVVFALRSESPLLPPTVGRKSSEFTREYALADGTAGAFASWAARQRCEHPAEVALAMREVEVVSTR
jgi:serine/threonine protein kinase